MYCRPGLTIKQPNKLPLGRLFWLKKWCRPFLFDSLCQRGIFNLFLTGEEKVEGKGSWCLFLGSFYIHSVVSVKAWPEGEAHWTQCTCWFTYKHEFLVSHSLDSNCNKMFFASIL